MKILVTGAAGFIGFHVSRYLCDRGDEVIGIDNLNDYYDVSLKQARLKQLKPYDNFIFVHLDIADREGVTKLFEDEKFDRVVHLAAQPSGRYSIENPHSYADSNLVGFLNILEGCRRNEVKHFVYASSSSVYGGNDTTRFGENDTVDRPASLYAATKKANEVMAYSYSQLYNLPATGLRFFTVYGPWGRPDMSPTTFANAITDGEPIQVFNYGKQRRDFTYIDDIVEGVVRTLDLIIWPDTGPPHRIYNIGSGDPVELLYYIGCIEKALGKVGEKKMMPAQPGDVQYTYADVKALVRDTGYRPNTSIEEGIDKFINWYCTYYEKRGEYE